MISLRDTANCHDVKGSFHVVRDFFGYATGAPQPLSLARQLELVGGYHTHVNIIRVGADAFDADDDAEIDAAIAVMRGLFGAIDFGVVIGVRRDVSLDEANGMEHVSNDSEAQALTEEFDVSLMYVDIFVVRTMAGPSVVIAPVGGPVTRKGKLRGVVVAIESSATTTGFAMARGVANYLGLGPRENSNNLMFATLPNGGNITAHQAYLLKQNMFSWEGCGPHYWLRLSGGL